MSGEINRRPMLRRLAQVVLLVVPVVIVALLVIGYGNWVPVSFSGQIDTPSDIGICYGCAIVLHSEELPAGRNVSFRWSNPSGELVNFFLYAPRGVSPPKCQWVEVTEGACSFLSIGGNYSFTASNAAVTTTEQSIHYEGTYLGPLL
jgi:hypothetical protein